MKYVISHKNALDNELRLLDYDDKFRKIIITAETAEEALERFADKIYAVQYNGTWWKFDWKHKNLTLADVVIGKSGRVINWDYIIRTEPDSNEAIQKF